MCGRPTVEQKILTMAILKRSGSFMCSACFLCGLRPLAMMVSVDWAVMKLPRCDAH